VLGVQRRKELEREIRRNDIVDAAERVFFSKGYDCATMDDVAREAEFSKRTLYAYFESKEQLRFEIMIRGYRMLIDMLDAEGRAAGPADAVEALRRVFLVFYRFSMHRRDYFNAIIEYETKSPAAEAGIPDESRAECYALGEQALGIIRGIIDRGIAEGGFSGGLDAGKAALVLWACTIGVFNTVKMKESYLMEYHGETPESFIAAAFELIVQSLRA
jgi:AcrR family transcriptional regulator